MTVGQVFLDWVVPALGGIVALATFSSSFKAILRARKERVLGDLNPLPYPAIVANCSGWVCYSYVTQDAMLFWPNGLGLLVGLFFMMSCYGLADPKTRDRQTAILLFFSAALSTIGAVGTMANMSHDQVKAMWGFTANAILLMYYAAPLSTILTVVRTRNSSSLFFPLAIMNSVNGTLWLIYGIARKDLFIAVPNGIGALLGLVLVGLIIIFPVPKKSLSKPTASDAYINSEQHKLPGAPATSSKPQLDASAGDLEQP